MAHLAVAVQSLLAAVFAVAVAGKLTPHAFTELVSATGRLLPPPLRRWRRPAAVGTIAVESLTVVTLLPPVTRLWGFALAAGLSTVFGAAVAGALRRGEHRPCRCFGAAAAPLGRVHLVRNAVLAVAALLGGAAAVVAGPPPLAPVDVLISGAAGVAAAGLLVRLDDLVALFAPPKRTTRELT